MKTYISRQQFLQQTALAGAAVLLSSLEGIALTKPEKRIKVGVIGCGSVSTQYLPHLSKSPFVELVSCSDIIYERALTRAKEYTIPNAYSHIDQLLTGAPFELMLTLTDMQEHGHLNKIALEKDKHVWSEKQMVNTYKEGKALLDYAKPPGHPASAEIRSRCSQHLHGRWFKN